MNAFTSTHIESVRVKCYFWKAQYDRVAYSYIAMTDQENFPFKFALNIFFLMSQWKVLLWRRYGPHFQEHHWIADDWLRGHVHIWKKIVIRGSHSPLCGHRIHPYWASSVEKRGTFLLVLSTSVIILTSRSNNTHSLGHCSTFAAFIPTRITSHWRFTLWFWF